MNANPSSALSADPIEVTSKLTVIMLSRTRRQVLARAMASVFAQELPANEYEVIMVIDGIADDRSEYLQGLQSACSLRILEKSNQGLACALNEAVAAARGKILLFLDDDLVLHPGNFRAHLDAHGTEESLVVYGPTLIAEDGADTLTTQLAREDAASRTKSWEQGWTWPHDVSLGPNCSISRAKLLSFCGFDEDLSWSCRDELGVRLTKMGLRFSYEPKAISQHIFEKTVGQLVHIEAWEKGKDEIQFLRKHPELRPHSPLAEYADTTGWKRLFVQAATRFPILFDIVAWPAFGLADRLPIQSSMRRFGLRLLRARVAISFLKGAAEIAGWRKLEDEFGKRLPVLMYHHVGPPQPDSEPTLFVSAARFEAQMRFLAKRGYVGIRPYDWLSWVQEGKPLPEKSVLITFDDAIADLYDHAFPVLERYGFNAVVFVPTNCIGKGNLWNYSLGYKWRPCMTAEQIQHWSMQGFDFGAHSRNHLDLTTLEESELQYEVAGSRADLEQIIGSPVVSFAYPYGLHNDHAANCVQQHFDIGITTDEGLNTLQTNRSLLRRVTVFDWDTLFELELMLRLGWNPIRRLRGYLRIRSRLARLLRRMRILHP